MDAGEAVRNGKGVGGSPCAKSTAHGEVKTSPCARSRAHGEVMSSPCARSQAHGEHQILYSM